MVAPVSAVVLCGVDARRVLPPHAASKSVKTTQHDVAKGRTSFQERSAWGLDIVRVARCKRQTAAVEAQLPIDVDAKTTPQAAAKNARSTSM